MRKIIGLAAALAVLAGTAPGPASAQVPLDPKADAAIASILTWQGDKQATGFRTIEAIYKTHTIARGPKVHPLPAAPKAIDPTFTYEGKTLTVWFTERSREYICEETGDEVVLMKDVSGRVVGCEKLNFSIPQSDSLHVALETLPA